MFLQHRGKPTWLGKLLWGNSADTNGLLHHAGQLLNRNHRLLNDIINRIYVMSEALDRIKAEVEQSRSINDSAIALIGGLAQQIRDNIDNTEALNALADELDSQQAALGAAVEANTPTVNTQE